MHQMLRHSRKLISPFVQGQRLANVLPFETSQQCMRTHATQAATSSNDAAASRDGTLQASSSGASSQSPIYVACVLERLPVVMRPPSASDSQDEAWLQQRELQQGYSITYPDVKNILRPDDDTDKSKQQQQQQATSAAPGAYPILTKADQTGDKRTMKRRLDERVYLLVRQQLTGSSKPQWGFPAVQHQGEEPISETCRRALFATIGNVHPVYFVGNKPMGHLPLSAGAGTLFFMAAQAVSDPWEVNLLPPAAAGGGDAKKAAAGKGGKGAKEGSSSSSGEYVWVTKAEAIAEYLSEPRMKELAARMLS